MKINFTPSGKIKPVHSVGQPPILGWCDYSMFHYLKEVGVKYSRLHDVGGAFGKGIYVDIPNLFRNFDADPENPDSYDFAFTDKLLTALVENGIEPYFRLGVTIENACAIRAYHIYPPKDYMQWTRICEGIIRHYTEGWANGYHMKISHWEIWNEPDNMPDPMENHLWRGTFEQYMELYKTASIYLKNKFPHLMIGGYGSSGFYAVTKTQGYTAGDPVHTARLDHLVTVFHKFLDFISANKCPLDFFAFHFYDTCEYLKQQIDYVKEHLDKAGYGHTELSLNEWRPTGDKNDTPEQASHLAAVLAIAQNSPLSDAEIYDAKCGMGSYSPLFDPITYKPRKGYYAFKAFNELYKLGTALPVENVPDGMYAAAAENREETAVMLVNRSGKTQPLGLDGIISCQLLDANHNLEDVPVPETIENYGVMLLKIKK